MNERPAIQHIDPRLDEVARLRSEAEDYAHKGDMLAAAMLDRKASALVEQIEAEPRAHLVRSLDNSRLNAEMDAARADGSLVNAWRITDGREVLATRGKIACAMPDGRIVRGDWPEDVSAKLAVVILLTDPETMGGLL